MTHILNLRFYVMQIQKHTKNGMDEYKKLKENWYLTGEDAVGYGLADELIPFR